ncbi:hypothetical protein HNR10_002905 [Nocardiopsis aegyptia]|uniref:Uncharacterized protein n=1 Tax=Nocardiopsis aegyptia TaxID=220378 RepID=A0A7Z0EMX9_9ACTN|nr:hypothetical protein [Nocardiopsis aegyptia]
MPESTHGTISRGWATDIDLADGERIDAAEP